MGDGMSPGRWGKIKEIFTNALELQGNERKEYLKRTCGQDLDLLDEVLSLLDAYDTPGALDFSLDDVKTKAFTQFEEPGRIGKHIGPYRIIDELGYGGMGAVYLAERADGEFEQQVAIKLLRIGFTSDEQIRRFRTERQILATLNHDNIARLYDGSITDDGQPYFVMEYVEGQPIDKYCDAHKLTISQRLNLFLKVCDAMQYAHRKLIVHRDLKPGNILITGEGKVKLLDFGIAKVLNAADSSGEAIQLTQDGFLPLTPSYASPEQIRGEPITISSDIYQLGIVLYELLSGIKPYEITGKTPGEIERIICEDEPALPSSVFSKHNVLSDYKYDSKQQAISRLRRSTSAQLGRRLRGDLDTIVMKTLHKEADRRYESTEQLAADIRRYLAGKPVRAHPDSWTYRAAKFVRRHRIGVVAVASIILLLIGYAVTVTWHSQRTQAALEEAEREKVKSEQVVDFMMGMFEASDPAQSLGDTVTARLLLQRGIEQAEALSGQPEVQAEMFSVVGLVYRRLGQFQEAKPLLQNALSIRDSLYEDSHLEVAKSHYNLATVLHDLGEYRQAHNHYETAAGLFRNIPGHVSLEYAASLHNLASTRHGETAYDDLQTALKMRLKLLGHDHLDVAESYLAIGNSHLRRGEYTEAGENFDKIKSIISSQEEPLSLQAANIMQSLGDGYRNIYEFGTAEELLYGSLDIYNKLYNEPHTNIAMCLKSIADLYRDRSDYPSAEKKYRSALEVLKEAVGSDHPLRRPIIQGWGRMYVTMNDYVRAEPLLREVVYLLESILRDEHPRIAHARRELGECLLMLREYAEAEKLLLKSLNTYLRLEDERYEAAKTSTLDNLVILYNLWGKEEEASQFADLLTEFPGHK